MKQKYQTTDKLKFTVTKILPAAILSLVVSFIALSLDASAVSAPITHNPTATSRLIRKKWLFYSSVASLIKLKIILVFSFLDRLLWLFRLRFRLEK